MKGRLRERNGERRKTSVKKMGNLEREKEIRSKEKRNKLQKR